MKLPINDPKLRHLVNIALSAGAVVKSGSGPHFKLRLPSGKTLVISRSASCWRAELNNAAVLRRILQDDGLLTKEGGEKR